MEAENIPSFIAAAVGDYTGSETYRLASDAEEYYAHRNPSIMRAQKFIYNALGRKVPDIIHPNHKIPSRWYFYFVVQEVQHLLGNGATFSADGVKEKLGTGFDTALQQLATYAINGGTAYGFWNLDHLETFAATEFCPLYDEETGALSAGIRWWQLSADKPIRYTLYERDGYTEYIARDGGNPEELREKRGYTRVVRQSVSDGTEIVDGAPLPGFPIVPLYNICRQSELVGSRETLDAYDLMTSGMINNVDEGNLVYWVLKNCNAMTDEDDEVFLEKLLTSHVAHADGDGDGVSIEAHQVALDVNPTAATLAQLRAQLFTDFMALDVAQISGNARTATQIVAAYEPLTSKCDLLEYQILEFFARLAPLAGIPDDAVPTFTRSMIVNQSEMTQNVIASAQYLDDETVIRKLPWITPDEVDEILDRKRKEEAGRFVPDETETEGEEE